MASEHAQRLVADEGFSLLELLVAMTIFGVLAVAGLPHIDTRRQDLTTSVNRTVADLRFARGKAITTGDHYAVAFAGASGYEIRRLQLVGGAWVPSAVVKTVALPSHIEFLGASMGPTSIEFNTRGMVVSSSAPLWPTMWDTLHGHGHQLSIWPSGQIYAED